MYECMCACVKHLFFLSQTMQRARERYIMVISFDIYVMEINIKKRKIISFSLSIFPPTENTINEEMFAREFMVTQITGGKRKVQPLNQTSTIFQNKTNLTLRNIHKIQWETFSLL